MKRVLSALCAALIFPAAAAALLFERQAGGLELGINPNTELVYTILQLAKSSDKLRTAPTSPDVVRIFAAYKDHPAVAELDTGGALNWKTGLCYDAFAAYPLYFSDLPEGKRLYDYEDDFLARVLHGMPKAEKIKYLDAYWEKVRDFYKKAGFQAYLRRNAAVYEGYVAAASDNLPPFDVIKAHEDYHGAKHGLKFHVVPLPLGLPTGGSYGPRMGSDIYNFMGPRYNLAYNVKYLVLHEFGHTFCNPVVEKHAALLAKYEGLYKGVENEMGAMAYGNWLTVMRELLVRSVHARLILATEGRAAAGKFLQDEKDRGFVFIGDFYDLLGDYEKDRARYPTLNEFYPRLAAALGNWELREVEETEKAGFKVWPWEHGPFITEVSPQGPGYAAGFREKDTILGVDGEKPSAEFLRSLQAAKTYSVTVRHTSGKTETFPFTPRSLKVLRPVRKAGPAAGGGAGK